VAGALLLTPGFLTDVVGLLGLLPPSRALVRRALKARFEASVRSGGVRVSMGGFGAPPFGSAAFGPTTFGSASTSPTEAPRVSVRDDAAIEDAVVIEEAEDSGNTAGQ